MSKTVSAALSCLFWTMAFGMAVRSAPPEQPVRGTIGVLPNEGGARPSERGGQCVALSEGA